jgi:hypothetical protein
VLLLLTRRKRRDAGGGEALRSERLHVLDQRLSPHREFSDRHLRDPFELGHALHGLRRREPQPLSELVAELGFVQVAGGEPVGLQDGLPPSASHSPSSARVMLATITCVQVRVLRPARPVPESRRDEALAVLAALSALAAADDAGLPLQVGERRLPGSLVRLRELVPHALVVRQGVQQADALRAGEDEVVAGNRPVRLPRGVVRADCSIGLAMQKVTGSSPVIRSPPIEVRLRLRRGHANSIGFAPGSSSEPCAPRPAASAAL